ncbi:MAG: DinB family protein [Candidatus Kapabacteria bacterium]|nr:DinB family protein [Candidatus Kapabacteria bacterium]
MTNEERERKLKNYSKAYEQVTELLREIPKDVWKYKPDKNKWSIHEIIIHLADSEVNAYQRCRKIIAEPGSTIVFYDQDKWAENLDYHNQSTNDAVELFRLLRKMTYELLDRIPENVWKNEVIHSDGSVWSLDKWLDIYENHITGHIEQMKRNYFEWRRIAYI